MPQPSHCSSLCFQVADSELLTEWERKRQEYKQRKRLGGSREKETLQRLARFQDQLKSKAKAAAAEAAVERAQRGAADADAGGQRQGPEGEQGAGEAGYSGKVREDIDHRAYMPGELARKHRSCTAAWALLPAHRQEAVEPTMGLERETRMGTLEASRAAARCCLLPISGPAWAAPPACSTRRVTLRRRCCTQGSHPSLCRLPLCRSCLARG